MPDALDLAFLALSTAGLTIYAHRVTVPRIRQRLADGVPGVRLRMYRRSMVMQWALVAIALLLLWRHNGGPRTILLVAPPSGLPLQLTIGFVLYVSAVLLAKSWSIVRMDEAKREGVRRKLGGSSLIAPHDREELYWFLGVAVTAGVCEEILYRGYAIWALQNLAGFWGAGAISTALFALGHAYQGRTGILRSAVIGMVFLLILVLTQSLAAGIAAHTVLDLIAGFVGLNLYRRQGELGVAPQPAAAVD